MELVQIIIIVKEVVVTSVAVELKLNCYKNINLYSGVFSDKYLLFAVVILCWLSDVPEQ